MIAGAGGFGREVYQWVKHIQSVFHSWDSIDFLDDNLHALENFNLSHKIIGTINSYIPKEDEFIICAMGDSKTRLDVCSTLLSRGARFTNVIHPSVITADDCMLGTGIILCPRVTVSANVRVGDFAVINISSTAGHDSVIEKGCTLSAQCDIMGFTYLEEGVFLGGGARILPGVRVGKYSKIGAGSVVVKNVRENTTVFGNPARQISLC